VTNADYIKSRLSDNDLCKLFIERRMFYEDGFLSEVNKVFNYWASFEFTSNGNVKEIGGKTPSIWHWERTHNNETGKWETTGRTNTVSFSVWLFEQYDKKYWQEAVRKYDEHWNR
jgi:hypothetical protein